MVSIHPRGDVDDIASPEPTSRKLDTDTAPLRRHSKTTAPTLPHVEALTERTQRLLDTAVERLNRSAATAQSADLLLNQPRLRRLSISTERERRRWRAPAAPIPTTDA